MGFFDNILAEEKTTNSGATATATAKPATPTAKKVEEVSPLIIGAGLPTTPLSRENIKQNTQDIIGTTDKTPAKIEEASTITILEETPIVIVEETKTEDMGGVSILSIEKEEPILDATPVITEVKEEVKKTESFNILDIAPTPEKIQEIKTEEKESKKEEVKEESAISEPVLSDLFSAKKDEKAVEMSGIFAGGEARSAKSETSIVSILGDSIARLEVLQKAKKEERDTMLAEVELKNKAIAELKKEAKDLLDKSREIADAVQKINDMMGVFAQQQKAIK